MIQLIKNIRKTLSDGKQQIKKMVKDTIEKD